ncbi:MAG: hypothetical protein ABIW81_01695 [Terrimesophilobacter sp.]
MYRLNRDHILWPVVETALSAVDDFVYELGERVRAWTGNVAQIIRITAAELQESSGRKDALVETWLTEGDVLIGHAIPVEA